MQVGECRTLHVLSMRENELTELPTNLGQLEELTVLDVVGNRLGLTVYTLYMYMYMYIYNVHACTCTVYTVYVHCIHVHCMILSVCRCTVDELWLAGVTQPVGMGGEAYN